jgi:hypothetical protein
MRRCAARDALVSAPVSHANLVVGAFAAVSVGRPAAEVLALLALVAGQDVESVDGSDGTDGRWRVAEALQPTELIRQRAGRW